MVDSDKKLIGVQIDFIPNILKTAGGEETAKEMLLKRFTEKLDDMIERYLGLPIIMVHMGKYNDILSEARSLFIEGKFYSCIAMCGVTSEKIAKELFRDCLQYKIDNKIYSLSDDQSKTLSRVDMETTRRLLIKFKIVDDSIGKSFKELEELRNNYVHGSGGNPYDDAVKAIQYLHSIIEGTISVFKKYEKQNGILVPKKQTNESSVKLP